MAETRVARIIGALVAAIDVAGKPAGLVVTTSRVAPTASGVELRQIAVYPVRDEAAPSSETRTRTFPGARRLLTVALECRCAGRDLSNEPIRAWAVQQAMADPALGGAALSIEEGATEWAGDQDSATDYSQAIVDLVVEYARPRGILEE